MVIYGHLGWKNGKFVKYEDLTLHISSLGVIHADATYDVMAVRGHFPIMHEAHIDRFFKSCEYWRLDIPYTKEELLTAIMEVHNHSGLFDSIIWISATRSGTASGNPRDLVNSTVDVIIYAKPYTKFNGTGKASVCLAESVQRVPDVSVYQYHKNFVWPDLTRAQWEAIDRGYDTALLLSTEGYLTEGPGFNVAIVDGTTVYAPRRNVLPGITMLAARRAASACGYNFVWTDIDYDMIQDMDDMFLTTTVGNIVTVTNFEGRQLTPSPAQIEISKKLEGE